jgi:uncharacterized membrane protein
MKTRFSETEKMLGLSLAFTIMLLAFRMIYSGTLIYVFYAWNLFLAVIPYLFSRKLWQQENFNKHSVLLLSGWLLFLPNAPYVITDMFHFKERYPVPFWYDLLLVISAAWNGLMLGIISLMNVENYLSKHLNRSKVQILVFGFLFICSYGIYVGRYLRFNSWDILTDPFELFYKCFERIIFPFEHFRTWEFTFLFTAMLTIIYFTLKQLAAPDKKMKSELNVQVSDTTKAK